MALKVTVNGEAAQYEDGVTLADVIRLMGADAGRVAAMVNGTVIKRQDTAVTRLNDGDVVEVISFAGGG